MALFMIVWKSLDPKVTTSLFASGVLSFIQESQQSTEAKPEVDAGQLLNEIVLPENVKLVASVHVVGQPQGFVLLQAKPEEIHQLVLAVPPDLLEFTILPVIADPEAKAAMKTRNSAYKLK
jgi:hypothetical protein